MKTLHRLRFKSFIHCETYKYKICTVKSHGGRRRNDIETNFVISKQRI